MLEMVLVLLLPIFAAHLFGIGVYNDTPGSPLISYQLDNAFELVGKGGWVALYTELRFDIPGNASSCTNECQAPSWVVSALDNAFSRGLNVIFRLGQGDRSIRNYADDARDAPGTSKPRVIYATLAKAYARYLGSVPSPHSGVEMVVQVLNEPNIINVEWMCCGSSGNLTADVVAVEFAHCTTALKDALLPLVGAGAFTVAPMAYAGFEWMLCDGSKISEQSGTAESFIERVVRAQPGVYQGLSIFNSHSYPYWNKPYTDKQGKQGCQSYITQMTVAGMDPKETEVIVSETGWASPVGEKDKARFMVDAFKELWLPQKIKAVTPFLLAGDFWPRFRWTEWLVNASKPSLLSEQWVAVQELRKSFFGDK